MEESDRKRPRRSRVRRSVKRKLVEDDGSIEPEWDEREPVDGPPDQEEQSDG